MKRVSLAVMIVVISTLVCISAVGLAIGAGEDYWVWENPTPTGNDLSDVCCLDADHAWAVGAEGTILFYDGARWNPQISPTTSNLNGVWAVDANDVWAVGDAGTVLHYDGISWAHDSTAESHAADKDLHGISASGTSNVIAVGNSGTALHYNGSWSEKSIPDHHNQYCISVLDASNAWSGGTYGDIYHYDGSSWSHEYKVGGLTSDFDAIHGICAKATDLVWAVGDLGTIANKGPTGWENKTGFFDHIIHAKNLYDIAVLGTSDLFITGQDGNIFRGEIPILNVIKVPSGTGNSLHGVSIHNLLTGWAVGDNGTILFHNGISWNHQDNNVNVDLSGVSALSADSAWAVGDYGSILHYDGAMWVPQESGTRKELYDVFALDSTHVWAVGDGIILFYDGNTWSEAEHTLLSPRSISGTSSDFVLAVGGFEIHRFNGDRWVLDHTTSHRLNGVYAFSHDGNNCAWAVGDNGHALYYDGSSWTDHPTGDTYSRNLRDVIAFGPDQAWAVGQKGVIYRYDGSWHDETWSDEVTLNSISALSHNDLWVAGDDETILHYSSLNGWEKQHHGSTHLGGVYAAAGNALWAVGDDEKVLFLDDASSSSWKDVSPSHTTAKLYGVSAADDANVWAVGEKGTILHYDGLAWLAQDSGTTKDLYGVSAFDAGHVWAVGDSGTILRYNGSSWQAQNSGTTKKIYGVAAMSGNGVCAVGDDYAYFYSSAGWKAVKGGFNGKAVAGTDMNHLWAVCGNHDVWSYNSGTESWTQHKGVADKNLYGITAAAVSGHSPHLWAVGDDGRIIFSDNGGSDWSQETSNTTENLKSVSALDKDNVWAVGQKGTILRHGSGWEAQTSTTQLDLYSVSALAKHSIWAVGDKGQCDTVLAAYPGIESCSPQSAPRGHKLEVEITGGNTNFRQFDSNVSFSGGGISVEWVEVTDARHLRAKISIASDADLSVRDLSVITGGEEPYNLTGALTIYDISISEIAPTAGVWGETGLDVHIKGNGTAFDGTSYAEFKPQTGLFDDITVNSTTCLSPTEVVANIDIAAGASERLYNVHVKTVGEQYEPLPLDGGFTICDARIHGVSPSSFARGHSVDVDITGYETQFADGQSTAVFEPSDGITVNGTTVTDATHATANITIAAGAPATERSVNVTTTTVPDPHPLKRGFKVRNPVIDAANPSKGVQGRSLTIEVAGLETAFVDGQSYATFDPPDGISVVGTVVWTEHLASVTIDIDLFAPITPRDVNIITPCSGVPAEETPQPLAGGLEIISAAPHIDLITANGAVGDEILIQGYNFGFFKGSSYVTVGGVDATEYTHWSTGEIKVKVPPGANTGPLTVTTIYGTSNTMGFTVTPAIDGLDPILGPVGTQVT
ncbi:MAG: IPT/TIG domain-containing protein, partial [Actinobacteria bacterium]|nr:IPT/TIG domain-containing protein [Actinomycetota bacterium]